MDIKVFPQFNNIVAGFTTKPDDSDSRRAKMVLDNPNTYVIRPRQVHGNDVLAIKEDMLGENHYIEIPEMDGLITNLKGVRLTSTHGDCIPVYAVDPIKNVIGVAHAGWKGTALMIAQKLIEAMASTYSCQPKDIQCFIGPGIDKCHFEFGLKEAEEYFFMPNPSTRAYLAKELSKDKILLDLKGINKHFLMNAGVPEENIEVSPECTYCDVAKFYSYRRCKDTKRMLAYIEMI